jgi:hypothetical protein
MIHTKGLSDSEHVHLIYSRFPSSYSTCNFPHSKSHHFVCCFWLVGASPGVYEVPPFCCEVLLVLYVHVAGLSPRTVFSFSSGIII